MKILHVLNELQPSGAETMLRLAATPWREHGLELDILTVGDVAGGYAPKLAAAGYALHHIPLRPVPAFLRRYERLLREGRYDVVHVHPERANFLLAGVPRVLRRAGVVRTVHNVFAFDGRLRLERCLQRAVLRAFGVKHVAIGESVESAERERFANSTVRVLNTFDTERFRPPTAAERQEARARFELRATDFVVAVIGNCSHVKNHASLLEALARSDAPLAQLLHVGMEREDETAERRLAQELGLGERVQFLGFVEDVASVLYAADAFVMPSLYEGLGIAALETLGCGVPSVLADVPGLRDLRAHVPNAWWVPPEPEPTSRALADIAALDLAVRQRWGREAASTVRDRYGVERHVEGYLEIYRSVASSRRAA